MCGLVAGFSDRSWDKKLIETMTSRLTHRGPDESGYYYDLTDRVAMGHRRLAIIDIANGQQPLISANNQAVITYNGEIYNHNTLREELVDLGYSFNSRCDTEVIVNGYLEWGVQVLHRLNGMFAFVIWDKTNKTLFAARDRIGIKPLLWHRDNGTILFASELKALIATSTGVTINKSAVADYFSLGYVPEPKTIYQNYHKLEAGHYLYGDINTISEIKPVCYWQAKDFINLNNSKTTNIDIENGRQQLISSIKKRMVADVPVGAFLSGGIDSSLIVSVMKQNEANTYTFSIGFDNQEYNEAFRAENIAKHFNTLHTSQTVSLNSFDYIDDLYQTYDEPFADNSAIACLILSKLTRGRVKVSLAGDGADELFLGYRNYKLMHLEDTLNRALPKALKNTLFKTLAKYYPNLSWAPEFLRAKSTFEALTKEPIESFYQAMSINSPAITDKLFSNEFKSDLKGYSSVTLFKQLAQDVSELPILKVAQYIDFKSYLPGNILTKVDRASMAYSLEVRVPYLDHEFVEQWLGKQATENLSLKTAKLLLKKMIKGLLPAKILHQNKKSFTAPVDQWFRLMPEAEVNKRILSDRMLNCGVFENNYLKQLIAEHRHNQHNHGMTLWSLCVFDVFLKHQELT